jgi:rhodanese-related sulfurtransferase
VQLTVAHSACLEKAPEGWSTPSWRWITRLRALKGGLAFGKDGGIPSSLEKENKGGFMAEELKRNDPERARQYFADKMTFTTGPVELARNLKGGTDIVVIDVRASEDYKKGHVPGAINLPRERWATREGLREDGLNVLYCYSEVCHLAAAAAVEFASKGYSVMEMDGGFDAWKGHDLEIESEISSAKGAWAPRIQKAA